MRAGVIRRLLALKGTPSQMTSVPANSTRLRRGACQKKWAIWKAIYSACFDRFRDEVLF
jgi:hypothetical protein